MTIERGKDYCSQLDFPAKASEMKKIENLQKMYTKKISEVKNNNYYQLLNHLKLPIKVYAEVYKPIKFGSVTYT